MSYIVVVVEIFILCLANSTLGLVLMLLCDISETDVVEDVVEKC